MQTRYSVPLSVYKFWSVEPMGLSSANENSSSTILPQIYQQSEAPNPSQASLSQPPKLISNLLPQGSYIPSLNSSTLISSMIEKYKGNLTGCQQIPIHHQLNPLGCAPNSSSFLEEGALTTFDKQELENFMPFSHVTAQSSGSSKGSTYAKLNLTLKEQLKLQYLSQELEIDMNENENHGSEEIHEAPQVSSVPVIQLESNTNHLSSVVNVDGYIHSTHQHPNVVASHKQRIRWMPELHELFLNAVDKLGGPESATPKNILKLMNVEGLSIYHVKSHLQKYRLAKNVSELKHGKHLWLRSCFEEKEKRSSRFGEKMGISIETDHDIDGHLERNMQVVETLRMQVEVQKILHEQLKVQRELQLQIEHQGLLLRKFMDEQQKTAGTSSTLNPRQCFPAATETTFQTEKTFLCSSEAASSQKTGAMSLEDCSSTHSPERKTSQTNESEQYHKRHRGESSTKPVSGVEEESNSGQYIRNLSDDRK